ncbi:MAG: Spindle assembly abnormal protein 6 [Marteilia pararefringens]
MDAILFERRNNNSTLLYQSTLTFHFKRNNAFTGSNKESQNVHSTLKLTIRNYSNIVDSETPSTVVLFITDKMESNLYYISVMDTNAYESMRRTQDLLLNFDEFVRKFIEMLSLCQHDKNSSKFRLLICDDLYDRNCSKNDDDSHFNASNLYNAHQSSSISKDPSSVLELIEVNLFRNLSHLSIPLSQPSNSQSRAFLQTKLEILHTKNVDLDLELEKIRKTSKGYLEQLENNEREYNILIRDKEKEFKKQIDSLMSENSEVIAEMEEDFSNKINSEKSNLENEYQDKIKKLKEEQDLYESKINSLDADIKALKYDHKKMEDINMRLKSDAIDSKEKYDNSLKELNDIKFLLSNHEKNHSDCDRYIVSLRKEVDSTKKLLFDAERSLEILRSKFEIKLEQEKKIIGENNELKQTNLNSTDQIKSLESQISKANEIIKKFQTEARMHQSKLKNKSNIMSEKDKLVDQLQKDLNLEREKSKFVNIKLSEQEAEIKSLVEKLNSKEKSISKLNEEIKKRNEEIKGLNKKIDDYDLKSQPEPTDNRNKANSFEQKKYQYANKNIPDNLGYDVDERHGSLISSYFPNLNIKM